MEQSKHNASYNKDTKKTTAEIKKDFEQIVTHYLASNPILRKNGKTNELEVRFGTNPRVSKPNTKIDYDNVVKQLYSCGFNPENEYGEQILRVTNEFVDPRTGLTKLSTVRAEITGVDLIQEYCRTNSLQKVIDLPSTVFNKVKFTQKMRATDSNGSIILPVDMVDFNFRVSYQTEQDFNTQSNLSRDIISKWTDSKKIFRSLNRVRFRHAEYPIFADLSIVKMSRKYGKVIKPQYTIQEAEVFNSPEQYEIELEVDNTRVGSGTSYNTHDKLIEALRKCIRIILSGIQGSKFPISITERDHVMLSYMKLLYGQEFKYEREHKTYNGQLKTKYFIGPNSFTLQIENIEPINETSNVPNIRNYYSVTDKADGERKMLYVAGDGKLYFIDTNMNIVFTGSKTNEKTLLHTLIDGEHIKYDKNHKYINKYAAFDIYYVNKKSVREFNFYNIEPITEDNPTKKYRLYILQQAIELLKPISILEDKSVVNDIIIQCKHFEIATSSKTIFEGCSTILSNEQDGLYEYNTDGIIFTPINTGVGSNKPGISGPLKRIAWTESFKWKPTEFNTIDFLVSIKKDNKGKDEVHHIFEEGMNLQGTQNLVQYKTLILRCGFTEGKDGYLNPYQDILDDKISHAEDSDKYDEIKPVPFQPTDPYDKNACFANIYLKKDASNMIMITEENEYFEEDMIVEFKYVKENEDGWRWVPLRVRYDKTSDLRNGGKNYGNAYATANNNWHSIHHPITNDMISSGQGIPDRSVSDDVYYNRYNDNTSTQGLRDFHNLYVKKLLIVGVSRRGDTLIDYAVGMAGDLPKWLRGQLSFVLGVDISKDNIHNNMSGACARYLNARKKNKNMLDAIFIVGNSGLNIRSGQACDSEKDKQVIKALFGTGPKDVQLLGKGLYRQYGKTPEGFQISSCQFAMHYFFENKRILHGFLRNLAECTRVQGYFIGTCYDGLTVFNMLKNKKKEESVSIMKEGRKIFEITKMYDESGFPEDDMSLGYPINVYQESINKVFREYLVNFQYFIRIMENYGFVLVNKSEAHHMGLPDATGLFKDLFQTMENEINRNELNARDYGEAHYMSPEEKRISFLNRYFIFKKIRNINAEKMGKIISMQEKMIDEAEDEIANAIEKDVEEAEKEKTKKPVPIKIKKPKVILQQVETESKQETEMVPPQIDPIVVTTIKATGPPMKLKIRRP